MPKAVVAEWFLRLFTTPDRAVAIAGDMSEEGRVAWSDLLRTAAALFFRTAVGAPFRLFLLLLCGVLVSVACWKLSGIPLRLQSFRSSEGWAVNAYYIVVNRILITSLVGYLLVRLAKDRDITACLSYAFVSSFLPLASKVIHAKALWTAHVYPAWYLLLGILFDTMVPAFFLLASGVWARKRYQTRV